ncbi:MAG: hypothetical protein EBU81_13255, partial [Proteobacteria bacterium]|nr:hypothetical protein [Pseudomonadota bacterium]
GLVDVVGVAAGYGHTLALKRDGTVVGWGMNQGELNIPAGLTGVVKIDAGDHLSVALKSDGTVVAWGDNYLGKNTVPAGLAGVIDIAAGRNHVLALKSDGTVVSWGDNTYGQTTVPASAKGAVALAGGSIHSLALLERSPLLNDAFEGVALDSALWSTQLPYGDAAVTVANGAVRSSNRGFILSNDSVSGPLVLRTRIKLHGNSTAANLFWRSDATYPPARGIGLGLYHESQRIGIGLMNVTPLTDQNWKPYTLPLETWIDVVIVDSGAAVDVYLNGDTTPTIRCTYTASEASQLPQDGRVTFMSRDSAYTGGSAASLDYITLTRNAPGAPVILKQPESAAVFAGSPTAFSVAAVGDAPLAYQWRKGGAVFSGATNSTLAITSVQAADAGSYDVVVSNSSGSVDGKPVMLTVTSPPPVITSATTGSATVGTAFSYQITATNSPTSYAGTGL